MEVDGTASGRQIANCDVASPTQGPGAYGSIEDLDEVLANFLPKPPRPIGSLLGSRAGLGWLAGLIKRRSLELKTEDAAEGFE